MTISRIKMTPPQLAEMWGVSADKIVSFIRSGELRAIDISTNLGGRPRFLIDKRDIEAFELSRTVIPPPPRQRRRRRRRDPAIREYF